MSKKLTILIDDDVYQGLHSVIGARRIGRFLNDLARPHVTEADMDDEYRDMAADERAEAEAMEWIEGIVSDIADEP